MLEESEEHDGTYKRVLVKAQISRVRGSPRAPTGGAPRRSRTT